MIAKTFVRALGLSALVTLGATAPAQGASLLDRDVSARGDTARFCHTGPSTGKPGVATTRVTAPVTGTFRTRLRAAAGDWDVGVFDAKTGSQVAGAAGPGPAEVASGPVSQGQQLLVQACRRPGSSQGANLTGDVVPSGKLPTEPAKLVRVSTPNRAAKRRLQRLGLDLTEHGRDTFLDVVTYGAADERKLRSAGFQYAVEVPDLAKREKQIQRRDRAFAQAAGADSSGFPSGRTGYRTLADYEAEMKRLAAQNPNLVKLIELRHKTYEGRTVKGIEITEDVSRRDGKPVFLNMGVHHAREWPSGEHAMEWAYEMVRGYRAKNTRVTNILRGSRTIVVPIVNPDGFNFSRGTGAQPGPETGGPRPDLTDPTPAYKRKNCNFLDTKVANCAPRQTGTDPNRNYGGFWGGPGAGTQPADETYRGSGPFSEPETQNVRDLVRARHVTTLITNHTYSNLVLRPPGIAAQGPPPDEPAYKALGDQMAAENRYASKPSYGLYDTTGGTEDWSYYSTGGFGFTFEIGEIGFHPEFAQVIREWNGANARAKAGARGTEGGNKAAYYAAAEHTLDTRHHGRLTGRAPGGAILRLKKNFKTPTSVDNGSGGKVTFDDFVNSTYRVPDSGRVSWHVNPSTRPLVAGKPPLGPFGSQPPSPPKTFAPSATTPKIPCALVDPPPATCVDDHTVTVDGPPRDNGSATFRIDWASPSTDYDMVVYRRDGTGTLTEVGRSGQGETTFERYTQLAPEPGTYVVRVIYFAAIGQSDPYRGKVTFGRSIPASGGVKESYQLTCEDPEGTVRESKQVQVSRGQTVNVDNVDCRRPRGSADSRVKPRMTQRVDVRRIKRKRFRMYVRGRLTRVGDRDCSGRVWMNVKVKTRRAVLRRTSVKSSCRFKRTFVFKARKIPKKLRAKKRQRFRVISRYKGSPSLQPARKVTRARAKR